jgi:hypothetical protein
MELPETAETETTRLKASCELDKLGLH